MTRRNLPTLTSIATDAAVLTGLPLDVLDALLGECADQVTVANAAKKAITGHLEATYAQDIARAYGAENKDFGTVRVSAPGYEVVVDTPKKVEWAQAQLVDAAAKIRAAGDDPGEYLDIIFSVPERKYTAWPTHIRAVFEPARTVKPGSRTVKLVRREAGAEAREAA